MKQTCTHSTRPDHGFLSHLMSAWLALPVLIFFVFIISGCTPKDEEKIRALHFVTWKFNIPEVWKEIYRIFEEEHPDIRLIKEVAPHSSTAYHDLLTQKLKNQSDDIDVFLMDVVWPSEFAAAGWAEPLNSIFPESEQKKFLESTIMANTFEGQIYGMPLYIDSGILYYRKDLLEEYGFSPPETWHEMVDQAQKIVNGEAEKGIEIYGFSGQFKQYEGIVCNMMEFILSRGGSILDPESGRVKIADTASIDAVRFVRDSIIHGISPAGILTYEEPESVALFVQGKSVFHRNWSYAWRVSNDPSESRIAGKVGFTRIPRFSSGKSYATLGGWQVGISRFSKNKETAYIFLKFLSSERVQKILAVKATKAPTRKALYQDPQVLKANPQFIHMKDVFTTAYPRPRTPLYPAVSHILQRYFSRAVSDPDSELEQEAAEASDKIEKILTLTAR